MRNTWAGINAMWLPNGKFLYCLFLMGILISERSLAQDEQLVASDTHQSADERSSLYGSWAFELPDGRPAWLRLKRDADGKALGDLLWSVGSPRPVEELQISDRNLKFRKKIRWQPFGRRDEVWFIQEPFEGSLVDDRLRLQCRQFRQDNPDSVEQLTLLGKRMPPLPPRPDLSRVRFGPAQDLFNGRDLSGWRLAEPGKKNGWHVEDGVLVNTTPKRDFGAYGDYGNLVTNKNFGDFRLNIEYNVDSGGNSGVYLRGMYEAQVVDRDSRMQGIQGPGAIFGRIAPSQNAGKPGGQWNRYVLTLVQRHISVELNGQLVIDNQPIEGCTGGGLSADDTQPGPIFLQGDHTPVRYRNIRLEPVISSATE
jgi:hypothetical protein